MFLSSIPLKWRELPIEPSQLSRYISQFPTSWYHHVLGTLDWSSIGESAKGSSLVQEVSQDDTLTNCYSQLVMACYLAFVSAGEDYHKILRIQGFLLCFVSPNEILGSVVFLFIFFAWNLPPPLPSFFFFLLCNTSIIT